MLNFFNCSLNFYFWKCTVFFLKWRRGSSERCECRLGAAERGGFSILGELVATAKDQPAAGPHSNRYKSQTNETNNLLIKNNREKSSEIVYCRDYQSYKRGKFYSFSFFSEPQCFEKYGQLCISIISLRSSVFYIVKK